MSQQPRTATFVDSDVRLEVYRHFIAKGTAPSPLELARRAKLSPIALEGSLLRLAAAHALVLLPGSTHLWMATPFSAVPTAFQVVGPTVSWWANCIWDALAIPSLTGVAARIDTWCADCGDPISLDISPARLQDTQCVAHFAVPAAQWWESLGYT